MAKVVRSNQELNDLANGKELVTNGDFSNGTTGWTVGAGGYVGNLRLYGALGLWNSTSITTEIGRTYTFKCKINTTGTYNIRIGTGANAGTYFDKNAQTVSKFYEFTFTATTVTTYISFATTLNEAYISSVSVKEIPQVQGENLPDYVATRSNYGFKNHIINGGFDVWQRGTGRTYSNAYTTADRFAPGQHQDAGYERVEVSGGGPNAKYAMRVTSSSTSEAGAGTRMALGQMIEHANSIHTAGKAVTLSFWIKFSAASIAGAGVFQVQIWEFDSINPSFGITGPARNPTINLTNGSLPTSWTKYTVTATTASTAKTLAFRCNFDGLFNTTNNSDFSYDITELQIEEGSVATPFEQRPIGLELSLCQRYYEVALSDQRVWGAAGNTTYLNWYFKVEKRRIPDIALVGSTGAPHLVGKDVYRHYSINAVPAFAAGTSANAEL